MKVLGYSGGDTTEPDQSMAARFKYPVPVRRDEEGARLAGWKIQILYRKS